MSNYPPGVTGNEFAIAGADYEEETNTLCSYDIGDGVKCNKRTMELGYQGNRWLDCNDGHVTDLPPIEPDGDRQYDERVDKEREEYNRQ